MLSHAIQQNKERWDDEHDDEQCCAQFPRANLFVMQINGLSRERVQQRLRECEGTERDHVQRSQHLLAEWWSLVVIRRRGHVVPVVTVEIGDRQGDLE